MTELELTTFFRLLGRIADALEAQAKTLERCEICYECDACAEREENDKHCKCSIICQCSMVDL